MMQNWADYLDALRADEDTDRFVHGTTDTAKNPASQLQALIDELGADKVLAMLRKNHN